MMRYADAQLTRDEDEQYDEALSPPVFLILTLFVSHFSAVALGQRNAILANTHGLASLVDDDTAAVVVRLVILAAFPLIFSVLMLAARRTRLNRKSLRWPFYSQCYPAAVFARGIGLSAEVGQLRVGPAGLSDMILLAAGLWLLVVEAIWCRRVQGFGWPRAVGVAVAGMIIGTAIVLTVALLLVTG